MGHIVLMNGQGRSCSFSSISREMGRITPSATALSIWVSWTIRSGMSKLIAIVGSFSADRFCRLCLYCLKCCVMDVHHETTLEKAFHFTPQDLNDNRRGQLSDTQLARLRGRAGRTALVILAILGVLGILSVMSAQPTPDEIPIFL